jgi:bacterioferritin
MDKNQVIEMLRADMRGEQQAIIQYLAHAYALGEGEVPSEIEAIAREEMRHLDWLADEIVELGGDPDMGREPPDLGIASPTEQMLKDVDLEQQAIDQYRLHMELIDDDEIRRLLARIVHDELVHQKQFQGFADEFAQEGAQGEAEGEGQVSERLADILNYGVRHEYTVILQYLYHSFVADDDELKEEMENAAINEMQHMGWLAEELQEKGQQPEFEHEEPFLSRDHVANLKADIAIEEEVTRAYSSQIPQVVERDIQEILARVRDHEIYHADVFRDLLHEAKERQAEAGGDQPEPPEPNECSEPPEGAPPVPPIGSLIK